MKVTKSYLKQLILEELNKADAETQRQNISSITKDPNDQRVFNDINSQLVMLTKGGQALSDDAKKSLLSQVKQIKNPELRIQAGRKIDPNFVG